MYPLDAGNSYNIAIPNRVNDFNLVIAYSCQLVILVAIHYIDLLESMQLHVNFSVHLVQYFNTVE